MRKRVTVILAVLALASVTVAGIGKAYAYFTTYVEVRGSKQIRIQGETQIEEDFKDWIKSVKITVKEDSNLSYYVRVKTFASSSFTLEPDGKGYWEYNEEDDYWYYKKDGKYLVDLRGANARRLVQLGLRPEHIDISEECTVCSHEKYWSARYTKRHHLKRGSMVAGIVLR